jgi:hypothetical protein
MQTIELEVGYGHKSKHELKQFRNPVGLAEMIRHCDSNSHIWFKSLDGTARRAKVNGKVRTWKRDPGRIEIPVKYGMYEYGVFSASDIDRILIEI